MRKPLKLNDGDVHMTSLEIQQRLLRLANSKGPLSTSLFAYELAVVSPALFYDDGNMRYNNKADLLQILLKQHSNIVSDSLSQYIQVDPAA